MSIISPWKNDFPIFSINAHPNLCYLDAATTTLTPKHVAEAVYHYQCFSFSNNHQSSHQLNVNAIDLVERARDKVANFVGANVTDDVIFTSSCNESINLIAQSFAGPRINEQSNIIVSATENSANLIPWQALCLKYGANLRIAPITAQGTIDLSALNKLIDTNTALVAVNHISNILGVINPIDKISALAHKKNVPVLVDGEQAARNLPINFGALDCDFYVFSGHKMYSSAGCGVLIAKKTLLENMAPLHHGGGGIKYSNYYNSQTLESVLRFEASSHNIASIVGLIEAINYLEEITWSDIRAHTDVLSDYLCQQLQRISSVKPLFPWSLSESTDSNDNLQCPSTISFTLDEMKCDDVALFLSDSEIVLQAGTHQVSPFYQTQGKASSLRVSLGIYNSFEDIDRLINGLANIQHMVNQEKLDLIAANEVISN